MKATLEFNLEDPDDRMAHLRAIKSTDMAIALFEIMANTKKKCLGRVEEARMCRGVEIAFEEFHRVLEEQNINLDELIN